MRANNRVQRIVAPGPTGWGGNPNTCPCCGTAAVHTNHAPPHDIDIHATCEALIKRCATGEMEVVRGDCPLEKMEDLFYTETKYTIAQFLRCHVCGKLLFWGLCVRGAPVYKVVKEAAVNNWQREDESK